MGGVCVCVCVGRREGGRENVAAKLSRNNPSLMEWGCGPQTNRQEANDRLVLEEPTKTVHLHKRRSNTFRPI